MVRSAAWSRCDSKTFDGCFDDLFFSNKFFCVTRNSIISQLSHN